MSRLQWHKEELDSMISEIPIQSVLDALGVKYRVENRNNFRFNGAEIGRSENGDSVVANAQKNLFNDFGSGSGGNIIHLVQKRLDYDFKQAVEWLMGTFNYDLSNARINQFAQDEMQLKLKELAKRREEQLKQLDQQKQQQHSKVATIAKYIYDNASTELSTNNYLIQKGFEKPGNFTGIFKNRGICKKLPVNDVRHNSVVFPVLNKDGDLVNLQMLTSTRDANNHNKFFLAGGQQDQCFTPINYDKVNKRFTTKINEEYNGVILLGEGVATSLSLLKGCFSNKCDSPPVVVGFSLGNIEKVVPLLMDKYPNAAVVFAGDRDTLNILREKRENHAKLTTEDWTNKKLAVSKGDVVAEKLAERYPGRFLYILPDIRPEIDKQVVTISQSIQGGANHSFFTSLNYGYEKVKDYNDFDCIESKGEFNNLIYTPPTAESLLNKDEMQVFNQKPLAVKHIINSLALAIARESCRTYLNNHISLSKQDSQSKYDYYNPDEESLVKILHQNKERFIPDVHKYFVNNLSTKIVKNFHENLTKSLKLCKEQNKTLPIEIISGLLPNRKGLDYNFMLDSNFQPQLKR